MAIPQKRQSRSSNKIVKAQDQVVDVTPLNSTIQSKTSSKIQASSAKKASSTKSIPSAKNLSTESEVRQRSLYYIFGEPILHFLSLSYIF